MTKRERMADELWKIAKMPDDFKVTTAFEYWTPLAVDAMKRAARLLEDGHVPEDGGD